MTKQNVSIAWCEECGDSLTTVPVLRDAKTDLEKRIAKDGKLIDHWEYYCIGCDKTYILTEKKEKVD